MVQEIAQLIGFFAAIRTKNNPIQDPGFGKDDAVAEAIFRKSKRFIVNPAVYLSVFYGIHDCIEVFPRLFVRLVGALICREIHRELVSGR